MSRPQAVVFDLGKVLLDFDFQNVIRRLRPFCPESDEALKGIVGGTPLLARYESGRISTREFFEEARQIAGFPGSLEAFGEIFANIFWPIEPMIELHATLRKRRVPTYIFSNTNELAVQFISREFAFFRDFDDYILSYRYGALKPDAQLYEVVERVTRLEGPSIIYLDDRPENVAAAHRRGWQGIQHRDPTESRRQVTHLLGF